MEEFSEKLKQIKKTQIWLSKKTGIPWRRLSGALGGYWQLRPEEQFAVRKVIREFEATGR